jgi:hypothetical protein
MPEQFHYNLDLPSTPGDLDLLAVIEEICLAHASRFGWRTPQVKVWLFDNRGTVEESSVEAARRSALARRGAITGAQFVMAQGQVFMPEREVSARLWDSEAVSFEHSSLSIKSDGEAEVLGLGRQLEEAVAAHVPASAPVPAPVGPPSPGPRPPEGGEPSAPLPRPRSPWARLRHWWTSRQVGTQLLVGVVGGLLTTGLVWVLVAVIG